MPSAAPPDAASRKVVRIVFLALLMDLLAFTMPLPLFPRIIDDFVKQEAIQRWATPTLLSRILSSVRSLRSYLFSFSPHPSLSKLSAVADSRWDLTLLGGLLGSLFSFCQCFISPFLGRLSDKYGRRPVLLASMAGNLVSAALWLGASSFGIYAASRVVGGLSEGNVQLSIACITDVTTPSTRSRSLALVGIAFSIAFTLGPSLGAYFASSNFGRNTFSSISVPFLNKEVQLNSYAVPAAITVALLATETVYLAACLPETKGWQKPAESEGEKEKESEGPKRSVAERKKRLRELEWVHLGFLFFFSGAEYTLTFLTHNLFDYSNAQNGRLLGFIGVLSSLLQGGYVRRASTTPQKTFSLALSGIHACAISLLLLSSLPHLASSSKISPTTVLYLAAAGLAYVSATVVNSLNALASLETDSSSSSSLSTSSSAASSTTTTTTDRIEKGAALGRFRSSGQLGRALGPLFATGVYWVLSPTVAYVACAVGALGVAVRMTRLGEGKGKRE
ncbi:hypothetical protein JCM5296_002510 [Sporobolomyces johnsonii]